MVWPWSELQVAAKAADAAEDIDSLSCDFAAADVCSKSSASRPPRGAQAIAAGESADELKRASPKAKRRRRSRKTPTEASAPSEEPQIQEAETQLTLPAEPTLLAEPPPQEQQRAAAEAQGPLLVRRPVEERQTLKPDPNVLRSPSPETMGRLCIIEPEHQLQPPQPPCLFRLPMPAKGARRELEDWSFWKDGEEEQQIENGSLGERTAPPIFHVHREGRFIFQPAFLRPKHEEFKKVAARPSREAVLVQSPRNSMATLKPSRSPSPTWIPLSARQIPEPAGVGPASSGSPCAQPNLGPAVPKRQEIPLPFPTATEVEKMKEQRSEGPSPEAGVVRTASTATPSTVRQITPVTPPSVRQASPVATGPTSGGPTPVSSGMSPVSSARQTPVSSGRQATPARIAPASARLLSGEDAKPSQPRAEVQIQTLCGPASPHIVQPQVMLEKGRGDGGAAPVRLIGEGSEGSTSPLIRFISQPLTLTPSTSAGSIVPRWLEPMASGDQRPVLVKSVSVPAMPQTIAPVFSRTARATHPSASPPPPVPLGGLLTAGSLASSKGSVGGSITSKEGSITTQTEDLFNRVDTNGDGIIDRREFRRAIKTRVIVSSCQD